MAVPSLRSVAETDMDGLATPKPATMPATYNAGDLLLMWWQVTDLFSANVISQTTPAGWTPVQTSSYTHNYGSGARPATIGLFSKVATGSEGTTVSLTWSGQASAGDGYCNVIIAAYQNASAIDASAIQSNASGTSQAVPQVTVVNGQDLLVVFVATSDPASVTQPAGFNERGEYHDGSSVGVVEFSDLATPGTGSTTTGNVTLATAKEAVVAQLALLPVASPHGGGAGGALTLFRKRRRRS